MEKTVEEAVQETVSDGRLLFRFALGVIDLTGANLLAVLRASAQEAASHGRDPRGERMAARALARRALGGLFDLLAARVADSPDLRRVIAEQSGGLTVSALAELRARTARADGTIEGAARRLLGRRGGGQGGGGAP